MHVYNIIYIYIYIALFYSNLGSPNCPRRSCWKPRFLLRRIAICGCDIVGGTDWHSGIDKFDKDWKMYTEKREIKNWYKIETLNITVLSGVWIMTVMSRQTSSTLIPFAPYVSICRKLLPGSSLVSLWILIRLTFIKMTDCLFNIFKNLMWSNISWKKKLPTSPY